MKPETITHVHTSYLSGDIHQSAKNPDSLQGMEPSKISALNFLKNRVLESLCLRNPSQYLNLMGRASNSLSLPEELSYDATGSDFFHQITQTDGYMLTSAEKTLLRDKGDYIANLLIEQDIHSLADLGIGSGEKTADLSEAYLMRVFDVLPPQSVALPVLTVYALDISEGALSMSQKNLQSVSSKYKELYGLNDEPLRIVTIEGGFIDAITAMNEERTDPIALFFLGTTIGDFDSLEESQELLKSISKNLQSGDMLFLSTDMEQRKEKLEQAYHDSGVVDLSELSTQVGKIPDPEFYNISGGRNEAFGKNLLGRLNRDMGSNFNLREFRHEAKYDESTSAIKLALISTSNQVVEIPAVQLFLHLKEGDILSTFTSLKFSDESTQKMAEAADLSLTETLKPSESSWQTGLSILKK